MIQSFHSVVARKLVSRERTVLTLNGTNRVESPALAGLTSTETFSFWFKSTDTHGVILASRVSSLHYALTFQSGSALSTTNNSSYSALTVDGSAIPGGIAPTRGQLFTAICDGEWHFISAALNWSPANWSSGVMIGSFLSGGTWYVNGQFAEAKLDGHFHYPLKGDVLDVSGNGNHGTLVNPTGAEWDNSSVLQ